MPMVYPHERPTLLDVAHEAGVSHITVSRVVRGLQIVSQKTIKRVHQAIKKVGYRPDPALSALAAYRTPGGARSRGEPLAFLDCDGTSYSRLVFDGARKEAALLGYGMEFLRMERSEVIQKRMSRTLFHRGVRGLIFGPSDDEWTFLGWDWDSFSAVSLGALTHRPALHAVAMDYFQGAMDGVRILREQGCRRIGLVIDPALEARSGHRWKGGYLAGMDGKTWIFSNRESDSKSLRHWALKERIDGIATISRSVKEELQDLPIRWVFLNSVGADGSSPHLVLEPSLIGLEGIRLLHHLLLRREFGIPQERKTTALIGAWKNLPSQPTS